tara:strand:- start:6886 stop:7938 length:1053 start_codon:yes stop_codon:yes gene_type:complete
MQLSNYCSLITNESNNRLVLSELLFKNILPSYKTYFVDSGDDFCSEIQDTPPNKKMVNIIAKQSGPKCVIVVEEDFLQNYINLENSIKPFKDIASLESWTSECFFITNNRSIHNEVCKFVTIIYLPGIFDLISYYDSPTNFNDVKHYNCTCHTSYVYSNDRYGIRQPILDFLNVHQNKCTTIIANEHKETMEYYNPNLKFSQTDISKFTDFDLLAGWGSFKTENTFYKNDIFGLSIETIGVDYTNTVLTEKTYKFYAQAKPVLVYSKARNIRNTIINLGFDPCDWLFDYSFEQGENKEEMFLEELQRLFNIPVDKLIKLCIENQESLVNNFNQRIKLINNFSTSVKSATW